MVEEINNFLKPIFVNQKDQLLTTERHPVYSAVGRNTNYSQPNGSEEEKKYIIVCSCLQTSQVYVKYIMYFALVPRLCRNTNSVLDHKLCTTLRVVVYTKVLLNALKSNLTNATDTQELQGA